VVVGWMPLCFRRKSKGCHRPGREAAHKKFLGKEDPAKTEEENVEGVGSGIGRQVGDDRQRGDTKTNEEKK